MKPYRSLVLLASCAVIRGAWAADLLRIDVQPTFTGIAADTHAMTVILENDGPDARGVLRVLGEKSDTSYPIELPRGARKRLLTLDDPTEYGLVRFVLDTDRGMVTSVQTAVSATGSMGGSAVLIGDDVGGLAFLREPDREGKRAVQAKDLYVLPENAPGRAAAYAPYNVVVLGPGAERMADASVAALKEFALGGGKLVFLGGASVPCFTDARWADALPGSDWRPRKVDASVALADAGGEPIPGPFTVVEPQRLAPGAAEVRGEDGGTIFETERGFGLGQVVALGYSPLDAPLNGWSGRMRVFSRFVRAGVGLRAQQFTTYYLNAGLNGDHGYASVANDPFSTRLPPISTVFGLLAGYFVLVVPVSFLVLRRMKRGELAWVTAPLLSLGFAGALFMTAEGLYAAKLSSASQGVVVLQGGEPEGIFYGTSQLFFPRGGTYDLGLRDVDRLDAVHEGNDYGEGALSGFDPVDTGAEVTVPRLTANNLAFREMSYVQRLPRAAWFRIDPVDAGHVKVENRSPYPFGGLLAYGSQESGTFQLLPGGTKLVAMPHRNANADDTRWSPNDVRYFTKGTGRLALTGRVTGFRPGPSLGDEVRGQSGVDVIAFAEERMR